MERPTFYHYFSEHPEIFVPVEKGPHFFGRRASGNPQFHRNKKKYLSLFKKAGDEKIVVDCSFYISDNLACRQIKKFDSKAKILILLRSPLSFFLSYYKYSFRSGEKSIEEVFTNIRKYKDFSRLLDYEKNLKRYLKAFGRKNVHVIILEKFEKDPKKEFDKLCDFLGISKKYKIEFKKYNSIKEYHNAWVVKGLRLINPKIRFFLKDNLPLSFVKKNDR